MDIYALNFWILMIFTLAEVAAVFLVPEEQKYIVWSILIGVGIIKGYGIAAFFMHLAGDPRPYLWSFVFPFIFVVLMLWGIGLSNPDGITGLPAWCTPFSGYTRPAPPEGLLCVVVWSPPCSWPRCCSLSKRQPTTGSCSLVERWVRSTSSIRTGKT